MGNWGKYHRQREWLVVKPVSDTNIFEEEERVERGNRW